MEIKPYLLNYIKNAGKGGGLQPTGTINITENGTVDVTNYASANVNVSSDIVIDNTFRFGGSRFTAFPEWLKNATFTGNLSYQFSNITTLQNVPNLNFDNVTECEQMFGGCSNLINVDMLDLSKCTNLSSMFYNCTNLIEIPSFNIEKAQSINQMFQSCIKLQTIPVLNMKSVLALADMFRRCDVLTNESLNNILASLVTARAYNRAKTLMYLGLSQTQAETCTTLSNWQACVNEGWTTGY